MRTPPHAVLSQVSDYIYRKKIAPPARLPSGRELASELGLDSSTLNRALMKLVARGLLRREGYKLFIVRQFDESPTLPPVHGLCLHSRMIAGAAEVASLYGSKIIPVHWDWRSHRAEIRRLIGSGTCEGLLVWTSVGTPVEDLLEKLLSSGIPVVATGHGSLAASTVQMDVHAASRKAVIHLAELGHREMAFIGVREECEPFIRGYEQACHELNLASSATRIVTVHLNHADIRNAVAGFRHDHPEVTGLLIINVSLAKLISEVADLGASIPRDLSIIAYGDGEAARKLNPPLTVLANQHYLVGRHAAVALFRQKLELARGGAMPKPERLWIEAPLITRGSTAAPPSLNKRHGRPRGTRAKAPIAEPKWPADLAGRKAAVQKTWRTPYAMAAAAAARNFTPIDLRPHVNQALTRFKSWIGMEPLLHLKPGRAKIHGVPFNIINEKSHKGHGAIVLRSIHARDRHLSSEVRIRVDASVRAIYFLHGCGWVDDHTRCAEYKMIHAGGATSSVALVPYGEGPSNQGLRDQWQAESNIQDWWPSFRQFDNEHARHLVVTKEGDPEIYERTLYTLEWINPHPGKRVKFIVLQSNPRVRFTLGVLAITLLREN